MSSKKQNMENMMCDVAKRILDDFIDVTLNRLHLLCPDQNFPSVAIYLRTLRFSTLPHTTIGIIPDFGISRDKEYIKLIWYSVMKQAKDRGYVTKSIPETEFPYILSFSKNFET